MLSIWYLQRSAYNLFIVIFINIKYMLFKDLKDGSWTTLFYFIRSSIMWFLFSFDTCGMKLLQISK